MADEYVLGLLDAAEMAEVDARVARDAGLARAVARARERFLPLDTSVEPATVPPALWEAISTRLPDNSVRIGQDTVIGSASPSLPMAGNDNVRAGWRIAALSGMAASLLLAAGLAWSVMRVDQPLVIAVLLNEAGEVQAVVEDFGNETASVRLLNDFIVPADRTMQVWTLPSPGTGPVSLGLLEERRSITLHGPALPRPQDRQLYEITLERAGGSPTGRPTGPILAKGFARQPR